MRIMTPILFSALLLPAAAFAQTSGMTGMSSGMTMSASKSLSVQDTNFIKTAAMSGMAEVNQGKLAESNGTPAVQKLGAMMVTDHTKANDQLKALAAEMNCPVPMSVTPHAAMMTKMLEPMHGEAFDTHYLSGQKLAHEKAIMVFETEASAGSDTQLKTFAKATLPTLKEHLKMIEEISGKSA